MAQSKIQRLRRITDNTNDEIVLTSMQKAAWVEQQIRQAALGNLDSIACPYCKANVLLGVEQLCCETMNEITAIFLNRMEATGFGAKDSEESLEAVATHCIRSNTIQ